MRETARDLEAPVAEFGNVGALRLAGERAGLAPAPGEEAQRPRRGDRGVLLAQRPGGGVARVGELARVLAGGFGLGEQAGVEAGEIGLGHIDLAAHLEDVGRVGGEALRDVGDVRDIGGDVLADLPVAAGQRLDEPTLFVAQRAGQAVDLGLGGELDRRIVGQREEAPHARDEFGDVVIGKGIVEAGHRARMRDLGEMRGGRGADLERGRIGADELREGRLERSVARAQRVEGGVADLGRVVGVIARVMIGDLLRQPREFGGGFGFGGGEGSAHASWRYRRAGGGIKAWRDVERANGGNMVDSGPAAFGKAGGNSRHCEVAALPEKDAQTGQSLLRFPFHRDTKVGDAVRLCLIKVTRADVDLDRGQEQPWDG